MLKELNIPLAMRMKLRDVLLNDYQESIVYQRNMTKRLFSVITDDSLEIQENGAS